MRRRPAALAVAVAVVATVLVDAAAMPFPASAVPTPAVYATGETNPVFSEGDAADDIAVWVDPVDPSRSMIIGTDKRAGIDTYDLNGKRLQHLARQGRANNVDIRSGFPLGGTTVDLVATAGRGMAFFTVDPESRRLTEVGARPFRENPYEQGMCLYHSQVTERFYAFVASPDGVVEQWELFDRGGLVDARLARTFDVGSWSEGCVADDDLGRVFISEEDVGIWRYDAEPAAGSSPPRVEVDAIGDGHLTADAEGLALVPQPGRRGYLIASSQGDDTFVVYRRGLEHQFLASFRVAPGQVTDGCTGTDGIEAVPVNLGPKYPSGVFICQDHENNWNASPRNQNFKIVPLERVLDEAGPVA